MEKLKFFLEYKCYPVWYYDSNGCLIDNDLSEELLKDKELDDLLKSIARRFNTLYIDTPLEFSYTTFKTEQELIDFVDDISKAVDILKTRYGDKYNIVIPYTYTYDSFKEDN